VRSTSRGDDAYRKVSWRIEKCSRGFRAAAMMEHAGVDQRGRRESHPRIRETSQGAEGGAGEGKGDAEGRCSFRERWRREERGRESALSPDVP